MGCDDLPSLMLKMLMAQQGFHFHPAQESQASQGTCFEHFSLHSLRSLTGE